MPSLAMIWALPGASCKAACSTDWLSCMPPFLFVELGEHEGLDHGLPGVLLIAVQVEKPGADLRIFGIVPDDPFELLDRLGAEAVLDEHVHFGERLDDGRVFRLVRRFPDRAERAAALP